MELIEIVRKYLNEFSPALPATVVLEKLEKEKFGIMLQQLSGVRKVREYINGSFIAEFPFALYVQTPGNDTSSRIDAVKVLNDVGVVMDNDTLARSLPDLNIKQMALSLEMSSHPTLIDREDSGLETYQAIYQLTYKQSV